MKSLSRVQPCAKTESEVTQSCPTLCDPIDSSPPGSSGIFQARVLEWAAIAFSEISETTSKFKTSEHQRVRVRESGKATHFSWEKIFVNHISYKDLISRICKLFLQLNQQ